MGSPVDKILASRSRIYYLAGINNPQVHPIYAPKGSMYLMVGVHGGREFRKLDDGATTNWIEDTSGSTTNVETEYHIVTASEALAKSFLLVNFPTQVSKVLTDIINGCSQVYGLDFIITGNVFSWNTLGLDGLLAEGDIVRLSYIY